MRHRSPVRAARDGRARVGRSPRRRGGAAAARRCTTARWRASARSATSRRSRRWRRCARAVAPYEAIVRKLSAPAATATTRCGRPANLRVARLRALRPATADKPTAARLLTLLTNEYPPASSSRRAVPRRWQRRSTRGQRLQPVAAAAPAPRQRRAIRRRRGGDGAGSSADAGAAERERRHHAQPVRSATSSAPRCRTAIRVTRRARRARSPIRQERLENPRRLFFDLKGVTAGAGPAGRDAEVRATTSCAKSGSAGIRRTRRASSSTWRACRRYSVFTALQTRTASSSTSGAPCATHADGATADRCRRRSRCRRSHRPTPRRWRRSPALPQVQRPIRGRRRCPSRRSLAVRAGRAEPSLPPAVAGRELERQVLARAPARARRLAHRHRRRPRRPRSRRARQRHHRSRAHARRRAARCRSCSQKQPGHRSRDDARHRRLHPARGAHGDRQPRRGGPLPLDPRQREPQRAGARRRDLLPQLRDRTRKPRRSPRARTRRRARRCTACRTSSAPSRSTTRSTSRATSPRWCSARWCKRLRRAEQRAEGSRREAGALRRAHRRRDAERARRDLVRDEQAGRRAAQDAAPTASRSRRRCFDAMHRLSAGR